MIREVIDHYHQNPVLVPDGFMVKFFMTSIVTEPETFKDDLMNSIEWGLKNSDHPSEFFQFIHDRFIPEEVKEEYLRDQPKTKTEVKSLKPKPNPKPLTVIPEITPTPRRKFESHRGEKWKFHTSENELWRSSKASFDHLLYRAQVPKHPEKFPWCQVSIESLKKYTGYSHSQITRALAQLQRFKRIKRIVEGNEFQGASKYLVFFTPEMSGAHSYKSRHAKKD